MKNQSKAIPFIIKDFQNQTYHLTPEAEDFLNKINTPISIVSVAGLYRTGKSFLLNRVILNKNNGFGVGPTVNPCTKGLWIWSEPLKTNDNKTMLVVDTEGLGALDEESNHDMKIFCLAVLLSTTFIYNSVGSIDESALQNLSLVLNLVNTIDQDQYSSRPSFIWVVRDFTLQLINENGKSITAKEYLEMALSTDNVKENQKISLRKTIVNAFSDRDCFTLFKPMIDESKLQCLDKVPEDQLRPEFLAQSFALRKKIFSSLKELTLNNSTPLKGNQYVIMIKKYITAINQGKMPNMIDTWTYIKELKTHQIIQNLQEIYTEKIKARMTNKLPMFSEKIHQIMKAFRDQIYHQFQNQAYENSSFSELEDFIQNIKNQILRINFKDTKQFISETFKKQYESYYKKLISNYYQNAVQFENQIRNYFKRSIQEKFSQKVDGLLQNLQLFAERKIVEGYKFFEKKNKDETLLIKNLKEEIEINLQDQIKRIIQRSDIEKKKYQTDVFDFQKKIINFTNEKNLLFDENNRIKTQYDKLFEKSKRKNNQNSSVIQALTLDMNRNQIKLSEYEKQIFLNKKEFEKEQALFIQKQTYLTQKLTDLEKSYTSLSKQHEQNNQRKQTEKKGIVTQNEKKISQLSKQLLEKFDMIQDLQTKLENEKLTREKIEKELIKIKSKHIEEVESYKQKIVNSNKKERSNYQVQQMREQNQKLKESNEKMTLEWKQNELKIKQLSEQIKIVKMNADNMEAINLQKIQLQQLELHDLKLKNVQLNKSYQKYLGNNHDSKYQEENYNRKLFQLHEESQRNLRFLEIDYSEKLKQCKREITSLSKTKEELSLNINLEQRKLQSKEKQMKETYAILEQAYKNLSMKMNSSEKTYQDVYKEKQHYYLSRIQQLQHEVELTKVEAHQYIEDNQKKSEEALNILKNYSDIERQQCEKRMEDERDKCNKKILTMKDEYEKKISEDRANSDETILQLEEKLSDTQKYANQQINSIRYDQEIRYQKAINQATEERSQFNRKIALLSQELELNKINFESQIEERKRLYQKNIENIKREMLADNEQLSKKMKEEIEFLENKYEALKKSNKKSEESNLLLKSEIDKEKALLKEKQYNYKIKINEAEEKLNETLMHHTKFIEDIRNNHHNEILILNSQIESLRDRNIKLDDEKNRQVSELQQTINSLASKNNYLDSKYKRSKEEFQDVLKKFQITVKSLSNDKSKQDMQRQYQELRNRSIQEFQRRIAEKEEQVQKEYKQYTEKLVRLQTQNKTLRDRLLLIQVKQSSTKTRNQDYALEEIQRYKENYEKKIHQMKVILDRERKDHKKLKEDYQNLQLNMKMQRSRISNISNKSDRSFIQDLNMQSSSRPLIENKNAININRKYTNVPSTSVRKQEKGRFLNVEEFEGIMKYQ